MTDRPTPTAADRKAAHDLLVLHAGKPGGLGDLGTHPHVLLEVIAEARADARADARAEGYRAGVEAAAQECESSASACAAINPDWDNGRRACAEAIRALLPPETPND